MSKKPDGGLMFPRPLPDVEVSPDEAMRIIKRHKGASVRTWLAGQALVGLAPSTTFGDYGERITAKAAVALADASIVELGLAEEDT